MMSSQIAAIPSQPEIKILFTLNHTTATKIFLLANDSGWSLPSVPPPEQYNLFTARINQSIKDRYGVNTTLLRFMDYPDGSGANEVTILCVMENHSPEWMPPANGRWVDRESLSNIPLSDLAQREVIETWFLEAEQKGRMTGLAEWSYPRWLTGTLGWIEAQLDRPIKSFMQLAASPAHCLFEIETDDGKFYFKAVSGNISYEQPLTCELARLYPENFPKIVGVDQTRHWWLMQDAVGIRLDQVSDLRRWEDAIRSFSKIQIDCARHTHTLLSLGCPDWGIKTLAIKVDWLFSTISELEHGDYQTTTLRDSMDLQALARRLVDLCERLASLAIPASIGHGDFNFSNILVTEDSCVYLDWATGYVGHPFFTLMQFYYGIGAKRPDLKDARFGLRDAYLTPWYDSYSKEHLMRAFELSRPLAILCDTMRQAQQGLSLTTPTPERRKRLADNLTGMIRRVHQTAYSAKIETFM